QSQLDVLAHRVSLCRTALAPRNLQLRLNTQAQVVQQLRQRLNQATAVELTNKRQAMQSAVAGLDHLSPLKILGRGYTYVTDENGKMLKATADYQVDSAVTIHTQDGE